MSELKINKLLPKGTTNTMGDSGDTFTIPAGATITNSGTATNFAPSDIVNSSNLRYDTTTTTSPDQTWHQLTGLNITHTAQSVNNRLLFIGQLTASLNPGGSSWIFRLMDRTNGVEAVGANADAAGSRSRAHSKSYVDSTSWCNMTPILAWVTPASTSAIQYGFDVKHQHPDFRINRQWNNTDSNSGDNGAGQSTIQILEIKASEIHA